MESLGERVRWLRTTAGITTRRLDELAGLTLGHVSQIENEIIVRITGRTLTGIAKAFDVSPMWLLDGTGQAPDAERIAALGAALPPLYENE